MDMRHETLLYVSHVVQVKHSLIIAKAWFIFSREKVGKTQESILRIILFL